MSGRESGSRCYGTIEGRRTVAVYLRRVDQTHFLAVPSDALHVRARLVSTPLAGPDATTLVHIVAVTSAQLRGLPRSPPRHDYAGWTDEGWPRHDDLMDLLDDNSALPYRADAAGAQQILMSDTVPDEEATSEEDDQVQNRNVRMQPDPAHRTTQVPAAGAEPSAETRAILSALQEQSRAMAAFTERLARLETPVERTLGPGVLDPSGVAENPDRATLRRFASMVPTAGTQPPRAARSHLAGSAEFPTVGAVTPAPPTVLTGGVPQPPVDPVDRIAAALEQVMQGAHSREPRVAPLRMRGVEGLISLDRLNQEFEENPESTVADFENAVRREAPPLDDDGDAQTTRLTREQLQRAWRRLALIGNHPQTVRITEALLGIYMDIRRGRQQRAMGRVALLLCAVEQAAYDNGAWEVRAATILGLPDPIFTDYQAPAAKQKPGSGKAMGGRGRLTSHARSSVADQVYKESIGLDK